MTTTPTAILKEEIPALIPGFVNMLAAIAGTVVTSSAEMAEFFTGALEKIDKPTPKEFPSEMHKIAEQFDAFVDIYYYGLNCAAKQNINLTSYEFWGRTEFLGEIARQRKNGSFRTGDYSPATMVYTFTAESGAAICPKPTPLDRAQAFFLIRMFISEFAELLVATDYKTDDAIALLGTELIQQAKVFVPKKISSPDEALLEQFGAIGDYWAEAWVFAHSHGVELLNIFKEVHKANMAKRWPDGKFHKREDGKIIKPPGWKEADIVAIIKPQ